MASATHQPKPREEPFTATIAIPREAMILRAEPDFVSQRTCEQLLGISRRAFLDTLVPRLANNGVPVVALGKARLVPRAPAVAYLLALAATTAASRAERAGKHDVIEEILARNGTVRR